MKALLSSLRNGRQAYITVATFSALLRNLCTLVAGATLPDRRSRMSDFKPEILPSGTSATPIHLTSVPLRLL